MSRRDLRLPLALCALIVLWLSARGVVGLSMGFLFLMPPLVMALPLLAGRYVGAERLSRISRRGTPRRWRRAPSLEPPRALRLTPPRGGLLVGAALAVRPPPLAPSGH